LIRPEIPVLYWPQIALPAHRLYMLPSRYAYMASVDHTELLRRSPRCSVITQRARVQQRPSQRLHPFLPVPPRALLLECGPVAKNTRLPPPLPPPPPPGPPHGWAVCTCRASTSLAPLYSPCAISAFGWGPKPPSRSALAPVGSSPGPALSPVSVIDFQPVCS
jgi:hypothetical protein